MNYDQLTPTQLEAVTTKAKAVRIIAGAGSGKTRVLTTRITHLIEQWGIDASTILAITFTNKAAKEMKERVTKMLPDSASATISTIHSLCARLLRTMIGVLGYPSNFTVCDSEDQKAILKLAYKAYDIQKNDISYTKMLAYISSNKTEGISPVQAKEYVYGNDIEELTKVKVYQFYEEYLMKNFMLDFDDLIIKTVFILNQYPDICLKYAKRYQYILVDEFQDVDHLQYQLIKRLSSYHQNIYVVGDPDQTIYTWRGSDVDIILNFVKDFENVQTIMLNENFRSHANILSAANSVIKHNHFRVDKELFTNNPKGEKVYHMSFAGDEYEAIYVAERIQEFRKEAINYKDIAILYRANHQSRSIEKALIESRIPYIIYGGIRFYERAEVKDILSYLRMLTTGDDLAFLRTINTPKRGIGTKAIEQLQQLASEKQCSLFELISEYPDSYKNKAINSYIEMIHELRTLKDSISLEELLEKLLDRSNYRLYLQTNNETERLENIKELMQDIIDYQKNYPESNLEEYLQIISLYTDKDGELERDYVSLMTIHAAKGLEFNYVFIVGMNEGIFPSERSLQEGYKGLEEERRLAYVAYTRAKKRLFLTEASGFNYITGKERVQSRFIQEIDEDYIFHPQQRKKMDVNQNHFISTPSILKKQEKQLYRKGDKVVHRIFGQGIVVLIENNVLQIAFSYPHGVKKIVASHPSIEKVKK